MSDPEWAAWTDEQLLALRLCDLQLSIAGTDVEQPIAQVNAELEARGLVRPHYWLSDEWFTPDPVPGGWRSPFIWRIRASRSSSSRRCWKWRAATARPV